MTTPDGPAEAGRQAGAVPPPAAGTPTGTPAETPARPAVRPASEAAPILPDQAPEDTDAAWGDYRDRADDRLLRDRPPHWDDY